MNKLNKSNKSVKKRNQKNKSTLKKCEGFCKNDYVVEMAKEYKKFPDAAKLGDMFKSNIKKQIKQLKQNILEAKKRVIKTQKKVIKM